MTREDAIKTFDWTLEDWRSAENDGKISLIGVLSSEKWEEFEKFHAIRALAWAYMTSPQKAIEKPDYWEDYRSALHDWLRICVSPKPPDEFYFQTCTLKGKDGKGYTLDRETCIKDLMRDGDGLNSFFFGSEIKTLDKEGELHLRYLITWFIRRYDLKTASWLLQQLKKYQPRPESKKASPTSGSGSATWQWGGAFQGLFLVIMLVLALGPLLTLWSRYVYTFFISLTYLALPLGVIWLLTDPMANLYIRLLVPRMAGCIIVGYLPLVVGIETWQAISFLAQSPSSWQMLFLIGLAAAAAFGYLILEIQHITLKRWELLCRGFRVYTLGLGWSLGIGLVILDMLALSYQKMDEHIFLDETQLTWLPGLLGKIPWEILVGYVPLALLIGIFLQIIWEEKPITEPL
ncbi:hypothetical protein [Desulfobacca acetoxidans]|uniref:Uncharacterized protein n=1 Tax=Desulfobacca acetoxidans (strain ATCC 700848 / DSM 11109 / ASRB2) TaxID=880072 RepID=F2NE29_DESAR|nr:hypothetical protein [Desulfobacca acetoxidans]AEB10597.1 hypothetical protein Desac_2790 [Desulfobacca acetoxidans DSM 11109]